MTILQYLSAFRLFGGDVLVLGLVVTIAVSVLKKTVLKNATKKLFVFLSFVLGTVLFAAYRCLAELSAAPLTSGLAETFESGFACGCAATLYYVVYEQFLRVKQAPAAVQSGTEDKTDGKTAQPAQTVQTAKAEDAGDAAAESADGLLALLKAVVPAETLQEAAEALRKGRAAVTDGEFPEFVAGTLARFAPALGDEARSAAAAMVASAMNGQ